MPAIRGLDRTYTQVQKFPEIRISCRLTGIDPTTRELLDLTVERPQCNPEK